MIVLDASLLAPALADDGAEGHRARERLRGDPELHAPHLVDLEVTGAVRRARLRQDLDERRARGTR